MPVVLVLLVVLTACGAGVAQRDHIEPANPMREWCFDGEAQDRGQRVTGRGCFSTPRACERVREAVGSSLVRRVGGVQGVTECRERVR